MTLFGELFWRDHLINSQQTPSGIPAYSKWIPSGLPANSKWIPVDSQRTPGEIPANSCQTPNGHPPDFQQISSKVDSKQVSIQRAHFESFFGEPILRAALETDSISWGNGGFPTDTQQSPNRPPTDSSRLFFGDLIWRSYLESSFGELVWRHHLMN